MQKSKKHEPADLTMMNGSAASAKKIEFVVVVQIHNPK
jgi:hypothetical protein